MRQQRKIPLRFISQTSEKIIHCSFADLKDEDRHTHETTKKDTTSFYFTNFGKNHSLQFRRDLKYEDRHIKNDDCLTTGTADMSKERNLGRNPCDGGL